MFSLVSGDSASRQGLFTAQMTRLLLFDLAIDEHGHAFAETACQVVFLADFDVRFVGRKSFGMALALINRANDSDDYVGGHAKKLSTGSGLSRIAIGGVSPCPIQTNSEGQCHLRAADLGDGVLTRLSKP